MQFQSGWFDLPRFSVAATGKNVIKSGESNSAVRVLQTALVTLGYSMPNSTKQNGTLDGIFGDETFRVVKEFQKVAFPNETPDGKVGPNTLSALDKKLLNKTPPKNDDEVWGEAPVGVPGRPMEFDLGRYYGGFTAVKQPHDMACWAACLSYWALYCGGGRPRKSVAQIISMYNHMSKSEGELMAGMPTGGLKKILMDLAVANKNSEGEEETYRWNGFVRDPFNVENLNYTWLANNTGPGRALYLGYTIGGKSHINVISYYSLEDRPYVFVMEPWDGKFKLREIEYYQESTRTFFALSM